MHDIEDLIREYVRDCEFRKRLNPKTMRAYRTDLKQFVDYTKEDYLDKDKIISFIHYLNQTYSKHKTIKRKIASVKSFFSYLEYTEKIEITPFRKIRTKIQEPKVLPQIIDHNILNQIFKYLYDKVRQANSPTGKNSAIRNVAMIELLFSTGIRISELCSIRYNDIDLQNGSLKIFGKGSKERILCIGNKHVIDILSAYYDMNYVQINKSNWFFPNKDGNSISDQSIRKMLKKTEIELNFKCHITPHMFRHTFATTLLDKEVDIRYIQKILGHSSISITQIYTHVSSVKQNEILTIKNPRNDFCNYMD